ncbi:MAG: tetratricopeptide repeat protein [Acidobacteriaceae bacterium]|nr:tetratricopeptide repeat protein [Acidobacteriaceae bacterium]
MKEGSIEEVASRLRLWCARSGRGLAVVEWDSAYSRREVIKRLRESLPNVAITELEVSNEGAPYQNVDRLLDELAVVRGGVVSITGVEGVYPDRQRRLETLSALSFQRETLASFPFRQVWWIPSHLTDLLVLGVPDLDSWFQLRLHLTEVINPPTAPEKLEELRQKTVSREEARALARRFWDRLNVARERGISDEEIWEELGAPAMEALVLSGLTREAYAIIAELPDAETQTEKLLEDAQASEGPSSLTALMLERQLAAILDRRGDLSKARKLKEHALAAHRQQFGALANVTIIAEADLLLTVIKQEDVATARRLSEELLINCRQAQGDEHSSTLNAMKALALVMRVQGDDANAERLEKEVAGIQERQVSQAQ